MVSERILLFGLSADPPTGERGHLGLVKWASQRRMYPELGGAIDRIWVVPVHRHTFVEKSGLSPYIHRVAMARLCFEGVQGQVPVEVSEAERELADSRTSLGSGERLGTLDLIDFLEGAHPGCRFGLLLGADTARDVWSGRWKRSDELLKRVAIVTVPRIGVTLSVKYQARVAVDAPALGAVSSTEARQAAGPALRALVTPAVAAYIEKHDLYPKDVS